MFNRLLAVFFLILLWSSCDVNKKQHKTAGQHPAVLLDTVTVGAAPVREYKPSETRKYDILHTKLDVKFNYDSAQLIGEATLTLKPYFYSLKSVDLDARGFEIKKVPC